MGSIKSLMIGTALLLAANGLLGTALGIRLTNEASLGAAGLVVSSFSVGLALGAWRAHHVIERVGHIRSFAAFCAIVAASTLGIAIVPSVAAWVLFRVAQGFAMGGNYLVVESWLGSRAAPDQRGRVLAIYVITSQFALACGQLLVSVSPPDGGTPVLLAGFLYVLAVIPVALTRTPQPPLPEPTRAGLRAVLRKAPVAVGGCFVAGATTGTFISLGAPYATALGLSSSRVATFMACGVLGGLMLQMPVAKLADRLDRRVVIEMVALATIGVAALFLFPRTAPGYLEATSLAFGAVSFVLYPLAVAHAHDLVPPEDFIAASGTMVLAYAVGSSLVPLVGSGGLQLFGVVTVPVLLMSMNIALGALAVMRLLRRRRLPVGELAPMAPLTLPMVAPAAELEVDRRTSEPPKPLHEGGRLTPPDASPPRIG